MLNPFTENQRRAIHLRGNVLVVAGAGTGKTRTLVQRCMEWLLEAPGKNSLEQILMVTFTEAAAAEMRQRIRDELRKQQELNPNDLFLAEQLALLETAFISTLHSFCFRLVRQHFYELELDPQVAVLAEEEARLLAEETLDALLEAHYAGDTVRDEAVRELIQVQARGRDLPVRRMVLRLHRYSQTLPDPDGWFSIQQERFAKPGPSEWRDWLRIALAEWRDLWVPSLQAFKEHPQVAECAAALESLPARSTIEIDLARAALDRIVAADEKEWPRGSKKNVRDHIQDFFREARFLQCVTAERSPLPVPRSGAANATWAASEEPLAQDWEWTRPGMLTLLELAREFGRRFTDAKHELGVVDFHDLEQLSLRLLWDRAKDGPTALARQWRTRLRLVFVDEYQDINAAQDAILRALGGEGRMANRFLVGDPKQSIYRFRLAAPHIFQGYTEHWRIHPEHGSVVPLTDNFRSEQGILDVVNSLFSTSMRKEIGGVPYDELAWLRRGTSSAPAGATSGPLPEGGQKKDPAVEFHLCLTQKGDPASNGADEAEEPTEAATVRSQAELEARMIGLRLAALRAAKHPIQDPAAKGGTRPVDWKDMVVLLRSPQAKAEAYAKEFSRLGIPLIAARGGFFESPEILDLLSLLSLLDNPLQDIPLLAVLRSPMVALTFDQLAMIRLCSREKFWVALQQFHRMLGGGADGLVRSHGNCSPRPGDERLARLIEALSDPAMREAVDVAWRNVNLFLRRFAGWRRLARETSLSQCLDQILSETHYTAFLLANARGEQQRRNLAKLLSWTRRFDQFQRQGLYRFLKFIEAQRDALIDHEPAALDAPQAVRLMSIHQSKGLEFNVVVVADLGKSFNLSDGRADIILDAEFGLCPLVKPPFTERRYPSLPHWLAQRRLRQETLGEELRLLYVAMTRARQHLILTGTASRSATEQWAAQTFPQPLRSLLSASTYLDWLGPWVAQEIGNPDWAEQTEGRTHHLRWFVHQADEAEPAVVLPVPATGREDVNSKGLEGPAIEAVAARLRWKYPFGKAASKAAKMSVSTLRIGMVPELDEGKPKRRSQDFGMARQRSGLDAATFGAAHHTFLEHIALDKSGDVSSLESEAKRLEQCRVLAPEERRALDLESIAAFWSSRIGRDILAHSEHLHRELPFTARFSLAELETFEATVQSTNDRDRLRSRGSEPWLESEYLVVTGVVDLAVLLPNEIWILDFKTDAVDPGDWKEIGRRYEPQIRLYALALSRIYGRPVTQCWLHSLRLRQTLVCAPAEQ